MRIISISTLLAFMCLFVGCDHSSIAWKLSSIDSLIIKEQYDSAYQMMASIKPEEVKSEEDISYYQLLKYQTNYLCKHELLSDSMLIIPTDYYQKKGNHSKLANCYYYQATKLYTQREYHEAIIYFKKAEEQAMVTNDPSLQYKISEAISLLNNVTGNSIMALGYAKKALKQAQKTDKKEKLAYSYYQLGSIYLSLGKEDSALIYYDKIIPYIKYVRIADRPFFLTNLSLVYLNDKPETSKKLLQEALSYKELVGAYDQLAGIYYEEGNQEEAYRLWTKAMTVNSTTPKDNVIHNLLEYDLSKGRTEEVCKRINEIIAIKDSVITKLKNDTLKDLQMRFDHQVDMNAANETLIRWQRVLGLSVMIIFLLIGFFARRNYKMKLEIKDRQIRLLNMIEELGRKERDINSKNAQICTLQDDQIERNYEIEKLTKQKEEAENDCYELRNKIKEWAGAEVDKVRQGSLLYSDVDANKSVRHWQKDKQDALIAFYGAVHQEFSRGISRKYTSLTTKEIIYLILVDMGKNQKEMSSILGVDVNTLRTYSYRIRHREK